MHSQSEQHLLLFRQNKNKMPRKSVFGHKNKSNSTKHSKKEYIDAPLWFGSDKLSNLAVGPFSHGRNKHL